MTPERIAYVGARIFDGESLQDGRALLVEGPLVAGIVPESELQGDIRRVALNGGQIAPGFVDLQVNGGGGVMFNDAQDVETLATMASAHAALGSTAIFPTLITDSFDRTRAAIEASVAAIDSGVPGIAGLHLEGPHLSIARKGAHDPELVRPMEPRDIEVLIDAAARLPSLIVTVAPESVTHAQINTLAAAGALVSLGHTDTDFATCTAAADAGARCVTHLFNAMRQLGSREPGVVGAALSDGRLSAGLIADLIHVHPASLSIALRAKKGPGRIFLITDAMAPAGSEIDHFELNGRRIERRDGRLTLADGTLAGADLDIPTAICNLTDVIGIDLATALAMGTSIPARLAGIAETHGHLVPGRRADFVHLDATGALAGVWRNGVRDT